MYRPAGVFDKTVPASGGNRLSEFTLTYRLGLVKRRTKGNQTQDCIVSHGRIVSCARYREPRVFHTLGLLYCLFPSNSPWVESVFQGIYRSRYHGDLQSDVTISLSGNNYVETVTTASGEEIESLCREKKEGLEQ